MAKWLLVQLNQGVLSDGSRLFSVRTSRELMSPVTPVPVPATVPADMSPLRMNFRGYALGLDVHDYRGRKMVTHTGGLPGYVSKVSMIPEAKVGIVVLTNQESGEAFSAITYHVLDYYLGAADTDWLSAYVKVRAQGQAQVAEASRLATAARNAASKPSFARRRSRALAVRHVHRPVARPRAARGRLRHLRAHAGRPHRAGEDASGLTGHGLQLRLSGFAAEAGREAEGNAVTT
jgi:hypothetical protein